MRASVRTVLIVLQNNILLKAIVNNDHFRTIRKFSCLSDVGFSEHNVSPPVHVSHGLFGIRKAILGSGNYCKKTHSLRMILAFWKQASVSSCH
jgi:hypothetical protein